jgi:hypothetical protein
MRFRAEVEPPEPMKGLEVPEELLEALGGGNGHSWRSRVAIMRGRNLIGLSNANRKAAGVVTGDRIEVELELDLEPRVVVEPADFATALDAEPLSRSKFDRLTDSQKSQHLRLIENAKKPDTRARRIEKTLATLRDSSATSAGSSRT